MPKELLTERIELRLTETQRALVRDLSLQLECSEAEVLRRGLIKMSPTTKLKDRK